MGRIFYLGPLILFLAIATYFALPIIKGNDPRILPSVMINKPIPNLDLLPLLKTKPGIDQNSLRGDVRLVNFFSSWCGPCRTEHEFLMDISRSKMVTLYGINYKDKQKSAIEWLNNLGDPYKNIGRDSDGRTAIDWGVYGVPETYLVDRNGRIQYRHVGPLSGKIFNEKLAPMIIALQKNTNE